VDLDAVAEREARVASWQGGGCEVSGDRGNEAVERAGELVEEGEDLRLREHSLGHDKAHQVGAKISADGGRLDRSAEPADACGSPGWGEPVAALAALSRRGNLLGAKQSAALQSAQGWVERSRARLVDGRRTGLGDDGEGLKSRWRSQVLAETSPAGPASR